MKDCVGTIDNTYISAVIPQDKQLSHQSSRNGECIYTAIVACDFDMRFMFVYGGWEGTATDSRIMTDAVCNPKWNFSHAPHGEFYIKNYHYSYLF